MGGDSGAYEEAKSLIRTREKSSELTSFGRQFLLEKTKGVTKGMTDGDILLRHLLESTSRLSRTEIEAIKNNRKFSLVKEYDNGGLYAVPKTKQKRKSLELEAADYLARIGFQVILKNETGEMTTVDGKIIGLGTYEQKTPKLSDQQKQRIEQIEHRKVIRNALGHARDKKADIAVVYLKNMNFSRKKIKKGIKAFTDGYTDSKRKWHNGSNYRFKYVIAITQNGKVEVFVH